MGPSKKVMNFILHLGILRKAKLKDRLGLGIHLDFRIPI